MSGQAQINISYRLPNKRDTIGLVFNSKAYSKMDYQVKDRSLIIFTPKNGVLAVPFDGIRQWADELKDICATWSEVRT